MHTIAFFTPPRKIVFDQVGYPLADHMHHISSRKEALQAYTAQLLGQLDKACGAGWKSESKLLGGQVPKQDHWENFGNSTRCFSTMSKTCFTRGKFKSRRYQLKRPGPTSLQLGNGLKQVSASMGLLLQAHTPKLRRHVGCRIDSSRDA